MKISSFLSLRWRRIFSSRLVRWGRTLVLIWGSWVFRRIRIIRALQSICCSSSRPFIRTRMLRLKRDSKSSPKSKASTQIWASPRSTSKYTVDSKVTIQNTSCQSACLPYFQSSTSIRNPPNQNSCFWTFCPAWSSWWTKAIFTRYRKWFIWRLRRVPSNKSCFIRICVLWWRSLGRASLGIISWIWKWKRLRRLYKNCQFLLLLKGARIWS